MKPAPSVTHSLRDVPGSNGHPSLFLPFDPCSEHAHQRDRVREHRQCPGSGHGRGELRRKAGVSTHTQTRVWGAALGWGAQPGHVSGLSRWKKPTGGERRGWRSLHPGSYLNCDANSLWTLVKNRSFYTDVNKGQSAQDKQIWFCMLSRRGTGG